MHNMQPLNPDTRVQQQSGKTRRGGRGGAYDHCSSYCTLISVTKISVMLPSTVTKSNTFQAAFR